jgi:chromosome segregation ATPase
VISIIDVLRGQLEEKDKEIEHLQHDLESEQEKTSKLAKRIHHVLGYIEGAVEVDINYVCRILLGKEDD